MNNNIDEIVKEVSGWDGVAASSHRFGGTEFRYGKPEIGHIHRNGLTDIPFPMKIRDELIKEKIVHPHHILPESGWISFYVRNEADIKTAIKLFRLSYLRYAIKRSTVFNDYKDELTSMELPEIIKNIYYKMFENIT
jgi:hypothetical protein